jgi:hypothetical protein
MKIFFTASIHGKKQYEENYRRIVKLVSVTEHTITADHILDTTHQDMVGWDAQKDLDFHTWVMKEIKQCDAMIADTSYASTSVGYLISLAVQAGKPVVIFHSGEEEPHLFPTLEETNDRLAVVRYKTLADLDREVPLMIDFITGAQDVRFNFFISPDLSTYLDRVARKQRVPRSVFLRKLIDENMTKDAAFEASMGA